MFKTKGRPPVGTVAASLKSRRDKFSWSRSGVVDKSATSCSSLTELIFVTNITNYICGEKLSCGEILEKCWEILRNFGKFCHNLRGFMWRKIEPKGTFVEKKWQIWCLITCIWVTRPKPAYGRQGPDWIIGPEFSYGLFSTSRFTPVALISVELVVRTKCYKQANRQMHQ